MAAADKKALPVVFLDIKIGDAAAERIEILLRADVVPKTAGNFFHLCKGDKNGLTFKNSPFHRIINGFMAQGGDITSGDGYGGESIYGRTFPDENFKLKHTGRGVLSCANAGADTNGSQFFLCFRDTPHLDGAHVVFGNVLKNMDLLDKLEAVGQRSGVPKKKVTVVDCGVVVEGDYDI